MGVVEEIKRVSEIKNERENESDVYDTFWDRKREAVE